MPVCVCVCVQALQRERDTLEAAYRDVQASLNHIRNELSTVQEEYNSVSHTAAQAATTLPTLQHKVSVTDTPIPHCCACRSEDAYCLEFHVKVFVHAVMSSIGHE